MEDIEKIEEIIEMADITPIYDHPEKHYLRAIAKTQILILEEMRKQDEDGRKNSNIKKKKKLTSDYTGCGTYEP